jgi:O-methyltransferase
MVKQRLKRLVQSALAKQKKVLAPTMLNLGRKRYLDVLQSEFTNEYIRLSQLDLAIHEIKRHNVLGDVAELGVYKGTFAAVLNGVLPDRNLYLFDTFEGFDAKQAHFDRQELSANSEKDFSDTSVDFVLGQMPHPHKCIVRKGLFPATAAGLEDRTFCFVSLDADLYEPILAGLEFFFDRLSPGGFIFVHDYNYAGFPGANKAVTEFSVKRGIPFIPITDSCGTAIFRA